MIHEFFAKPWGCIIGYSMMGLVGVVFALVALALVAFGVYWVGRGALRAALHPIESVRDVAHSARNAEWADVAIYGGAALVIIAFIVLPPILVAPCERPKTQTETIGNAGTHRIVIHFGPGLATCDPQAGDVSVKPGEAVAREVSGTATGEVSLINCPDAEPEIAQ